MMTKYEIDNKRKSVTKLKKKIMMMKVGNNIGMPLG